MCEWGTQVQHEEVTQRPGSLISSPTQEGEAQVEGGSLGTLERRGGRSPVGRGSLGILARALARALCGGGAACRANVASKGGARQARASGTQQ